MFVTDSLLHNRIIYIENLLDPFKCTIIGKSIYRSRIAYCFNYGTIIRQYSNERFIA
jgi:hypothetical protein